MSEISADNASLIHTIATATAIIAALISACAVILAQLTSEVQTKHSDQSMENASQLIASANQSAAQSQLKIDALTQQNLELTARLRAAEHAAQQARAQAQAHLQPRKLTVQAQAAFTALAAELAKAKATPTVLLNIVKNDDEALAFSKQIAVALTKAGVRVQIKQLMLTKEATGTHVVVYNSPGSLQIEHALMAANIASQLNRSSQTPKINIDDQDTAAISAFISVYPKGVSLAEASEPSAD